ncbi:MAG: 4-(cytidine 5'-diphospho)-2-C-methyl-D-erythritol kinase [Clostridia bacterium]|nr:4-(cytidine 5'-diphospho)-2-C-methyl-D-erythritol kinase [Clostridia bacterium]
MDTITEKAYAKINLTLGVRAKRPDGYHELDSLMQTVSLHDTVTVTRAREVTVLSSGMVLPYNNTLRKAAALYEAYTGRGALIRVEKRIPAEAGLGGGSADAAAVLRALDRMYGETDRSTLNDIALKVGADVPFCMHGGLCRAEGIGEVLTPLKGMHLDLVIAKPEQGVSTAALFRALTLPREMPDTAGAMRAIGANDAETLGKLLVNALEEPAVALVPEIGKLVSRLKDLGAVGARMTGSGSAVFGLFRSAEEARHAAANLKDETFFAEACETV